MSVSVFPSNTAGNLAPYWYRVLLGRGVSHPLAHLTEAVGVRAEPVGARGRPGVREARCVRAVCTGPFPPRCCLCSNRSPVLPQRGLRAGGRGPGEVTLASASQVTNKGA